MLATKRAKHQALLDIDTAICNADGSVRGRKVESLVRKAEKLGVPLRKIQTTVENAVDAYGDAYNPEEYEVLPPPRRR